MQCPQCKIKLNGAAKFCSECGEKIGGGSTLGFDSGDQVTRIQKRPDFVVNPATIPSQVRQKIERAQESLGGARRLVTVMFADVQGFTSLCEKLDAESVRDLMNRYLGRFGEVVYEYEGYIDKFMGDCMMALFGAPMAHENDPELACRTAIKILEELKRLNRTTGHELGIRIGINSGMVITGGVGSNLKLDFTVMGDAVNIAQRLQTAAAPNEIVVGKSVQAACRTLFEFGEQSAGKLKGKSADVEMYRLIGYKTREFSNRGLRENQLKLIGREKEVKQLEEALDHLKNHRPKPLVILGEAGTGKSRLKLELRNMAKAKGLHWFESKGSELKASLPYFPIQTLLQQMLKDFFEIDPQTQKPSLLPLDMYGIDRISKIFIDELLHVNTGKMQIDAQQKRIATFKVLRTLFEKFGEKQPFICFIDDFHFADQMTRELWEFLSGSAVNYLMVAASREEKQKVEAHGQRLVLSPLTSAASIELAQSLLKTTELPPTFKQLVEERCQGNPLFIEEMTKTLLESGKLSKQGTSWVFHDTADAIELPDSIHAIVLSRLDRLYPSDREVLECAAIIGRNFTDKLLKTIMNNREGIDESLQFLRKRELIFETSVNAGVVEYAFNQILTQEVTYNSILLKRRKSLHKIVADTWETLIREKSLESDESIFDTLAYHYQKSETEPVKAAFYLKRSAEVQQQSSSLKDAKTSYQKALQLLEGESGNASSGLRTEIQLAYSELLLLSGENAPAVEILTKLCDQSELTTVKFQSLLKLSDYFRRAGKLAEARSHMEKADLIPREKESMETQASLLKSMGNLHRAEGNLDQSISTFQSALQFAPHLSASRVLGEILNDLGATLIQANQLETATLTLKKSVQWAQMAKDRVIEVRSLLNLGSLALLQGKTDEALTEFSKVSEIAEQIGDIPDQVVGLHNHGIAAIKIERWDQAEKSLTTCEHLANLVDMPKEKDSCGVLLSQLRRSQ
jgi:class 3 adenylate cyclase